jgi:hypothetical protein
VQRIASRYSKQVQVWNVVSGIHANNSFNLSFEQLMELTRMCCLLVKKLSPHATVMLELVMPWGEYYAHNRRTIPPMMYADMAVQSGIKFDAFGLQLMMGIPQDGHFVRDLLQISSLLDEFVAFGKTVHVSACQVPSNVPRNKHRSPDGNVPVVDSGNGFRRFIASRYPSPSSSPSAGGIWLTTTGTVSPTGDSATAT